MSSVLRLVPPAPSKDTIAAVEALLAAARRGDVVGIAWAEIRVGGHWEVRAVGEANARPSYTAGLLVKLFLALSKQT